MKTRLALLTGLNSSCEMAVLPNQPQAVGWSGTWLEHSCKRLQPSRWFRSYFQQHVVAFELQLFLRADAQRPGCAELAKEFPAAVALSCHLSMERREHDHTTPWTVCSRTAEGGR